MWLCRRTCTTINLFVGVCVGDLDDKVISIRQISHIKYLFYSMLHHILNFRYFKYFKITHCIGFKPFIFTINLNTMSLWTLHFLLLCVFHLKRRDSFFILKKSFLENGLESPLIFVLF